PAVARAHTESAAGTAEWTEATAAHAAWPPQAAAARWRRPSQHIARIIHFHADQPAVISRAIPGVAAVGHIHVATQDRQRATLVLRHSREDRASEMCFGIHVHWQ